MMGKAATKTGASDRVSSLVQEIINDFRESPIEFMDSGDSEGETQYLIQHQHTYVRTIRDILAHAGDADPGTVAILEIGPFFGVTSIALAELGFDITVVDIEEFMANARIRERFHRHAVKFETCNLRDARLPFSTAQFDITIMCETLEHFDFNPLPALREVYRALKPGGLFYVTVPNQAVLDHRVNLLVGESIHNPVGDFFSQLEPNSTMIVGLHWREYTAAEMRQMLEGLDLEVVEQRYEMGYDWSQPALGLKRRAKRLAWQILNRPAVRRAINRLMFDAGFDPSLRDIQITLATKPLR